MEQIIAQLSNTMILTEDDLARFQAYIEKKYVDSTRAERTAVLSDSLRRVVDKHLNGVDPFYHEGLKNHLFKNTLDQGQKYITKGDLFQEIITFADHEAYPWLIDQYPHYIDEVTPALVHNYVKHMNQTSPQQNPKPIDDISRPLKTNPRHHLLMMIVCAFLPFLIPSRKVLSRSFAFGLCLVIGFFGFQTLQMLPYVLPSQVETPKAKPVPIEPVFQEAKPEAPQIQQVSAPIVEPPVTHRILPLTVDVVKVAEKALPRPTVEIIKISTKEIFTAQKNHSLQYELFDSEKLKTYLIQMDSILAESPYFETMIQTARDHDIDPRVLFAITAQEQSLVKRTNEHASKIANNPFNVYGSWQIYNTTISDSSEVVCNTISNRLSSKPTGVDPFIWLNMTYAEDQNWHNGVRKYYDLFKILTAPPSIG